ncbi:cytochrome P450 [Nocardioides sp. REDSEA-S30_B4]|uniref:cytochrome P450 n=1 Tax=Nocardioides sp. REDSEA-S30_B4 TaxID=1811552 RepID=UPI000A560AEA|nr:cytochrome P450 [Nocardioides sp. REDSEA-S30_B4]
MTIADTPLAAFDPTDPDVLAERVPHEEMLAMRRTAPVSFVAQDEDARAGFPDHQGFWALSKHADVAAVSKNQTDFSTQANGVIMRFAPGMTKEEREQSGFLLINHDAPDHTKLRQIVSRAFTPRAINALHDDLKARAQKIWADAVESGSGDFVEQVAAELPLQAIADLLGVPQEDRGKLFEWSNQMMSYDDPTVEGDQMVAFMEILAYSMALADERRKNPQDDIVTKLVTADVDGRGLTDDEFGFFMILLAVAGNETTRNAITWGMHAFATNPDQWETFVAQRPATATDEIIRWATPVTAFQRTALRDVEVGGVTIPEGERVGLLYASANFDEDVFTDPFTFDVLREHNPHQAFGGHGAHYCIGANLARMEVDLIFNAIADSGVRVELLGEPARLRSGWLNGVKSLPVAYHR